MGKTDFKIRQATINDIESVINLLKISDMLQYPEVDGEVALSRILSNDNALWLVAENKDACVIGSIRGSWDGSRAFIHQLVVDNSMQRQGVASRLVNSLVNYFIDLGAPTVAVTVSEKKIGFFQKLGFNPTNISLMIRDVDPKKRFSKSG